MADRVKIKIDDTRMRLRLAGLSRAAPDAARIFAAVMACEIMRFAIAAGPKDTNRYVRAWQIAHNMAAHWTEGRISPWTVFAVKESKYHRQNFHRLERQVQVQEQRLRDLRRSIREMETHPGHQEWKTYQRAKANEIKTQKMYEGALAQITAIDQSPEGTSAIVIGGRKTKSAYAMGRIARAVVRVYGGEARIVRVGNRVFVEARNKEPHASIVESRTRLISRALKSSRSLGLSTASAGYIKRLQQGVAA